MNVCWSATSLYWRYWELHFFLPPPFSSGVPPATLLIQKIDKEIESRRSSRWTTFYLGLSKVTRVLFIRFLFYLSILAHDWYASGHHLKFSQSIYSGMYFCIFIISVDWWTMWAMNNPHKCIQITNSNSDIAQPLQTQRQCLFKMMDLSQREAHNPATGSSCRFCSTLIYNG